MLTFFTAAALLLQPAPVAEASGSSTADSGSVGAVTAEAVAALVAEFDAPQRSVRDEAERRLAGLGPAVLKHLPQPGPGASAERTIRLNRVRSAVYRTQVAVDLRGTEVEWPRGSTQLPAVLAAFEKQSGNRLIDYRRQFGQQVDDARFEFETPRVPFWEGIDRLCLAAGAEPYFFAGEDGLALVARGTPATAAGWKGRPAHVDYRGAFRIEVEQVVASRRPEAASGELRVELSAAWEPRLKPMFVTLSVRKMEATDATGRRLEPSNPDLVLEIPPPGKACRIEAAASFQAPPRSVSQIGRLRGAFDVLIPAARHAFRFSPAASMEKRTEQVGGVTVTLEPLRPNGDLVEAVVRLAYENPVNALESHRAWFYKNPAYLESREGGRYTPGTIELVRQSDDELTLKLHFSSTMDWRAMTFVYETPADFVVVPAEFEFKDMPLP